MLKVCTQEYCEAEVAHFAATMPNFPPMLDAGETFREILREVELINRASRAQAALTWPPCEAPQ